MTRNLLSSTLLLALSSYAHAQGFGGGDPYSNNNPNSNSNNGDDNSHFGGSDFDSFIAQKKTMVYAHAAVAAIAFGILFPAGSILIRLGSFRGLWLVHGLFQLFAYVCYMGAAGLGIHMARQLDLFHNPDKHIIIGLLLLLVLFFQPIFGFIHHFAFKKYGTRVTWSHMHIWLGRIAITLGIVNGGFGLQFAQKLHMFPPSHTVIIAYSVIAVVVWVIYMASALYGEVKRNRAQKYVPVSPMDVGSAPPPYKSEGRDGMRYA